MSTPGPMPVDPSWPFTVDVTPFDSEDAMRLRAAARVETDGIVGQRSDFGTELSAPMLAAHFVAHDRFGTPLGCGGLASVGDGVYEIRRLYVRSDMRTHGVGSEILRRLEIVASELGAPAVVYETAPQMLRALEFFDRRGYHRIALWGPYVQSPFSVALAKTF